jgi:hypothetical protein
VISCQPPGGLPSQPDVIGATAWPVHAHDASIFSLVARSRSQADAREGSDDRTFVMFVREGDYCFGAVAMLVLAIIVLLQRPMIQPSMTFSATNRAVSRRPGLQRLSWLGPVESLNLDLALETGRNTASRIQ